MMKSFIRASVVVLFACLWVREVTCQCPTMGMDCYVLVTLSQNVTKDSFAQLIDYYAEMSDKCGVELTHNIYFGFKKKVSIQTSDFLATWFRSKLNSDYYPAALTSDDALEQTDRDGNLTSIFNSFLLDLGDQNNFPTSKKTFAIITDYVNLNLTAFVPVGLNKLNAEVYVITPSTEVADMTNDMQKFTVCITDAELTNNCSHVFCTPIPLTVVDNVVLSNSNSVIYLANYTEDLWMLKGIAKEIASGPLCHLEPAEIKSNFIRVHFLMQNRSQQINLPWVGKNTTSFYDYCIDSVLSRTLGLSGVINGGPGAYCNGDNPFFHNLAFDLRNSTLSGIFVSYYDSVTPNCLKDILLDTNTVHPNVQVFLGITDTVARTHTFNQFTFPVHSYITDPKADVHVSYVTEPSQFAISNLACQLSVHQVNLIPGQPFKYRESWNLAWSQFIVVIVLCLISAISVGTFFYHRVKKMHMDRIGDESEEYKVGKMCLTKEENMHNDCLPWEVHIDRVQINYEFPLGEGASFMIYLGKLKGKAPVTQWINLAEMKQFQDCAVAIRIPRRYDAEEEHQLLREINAMKMIKHHDYIANLLGWVNKNNFACTILELTHTTLLRYVKQLKDGVKLNDVESTVCLLPFKQYLRILTQITDAMKYVASKGLVHRDIAARNVLLTTGLRAKISGFNYCSIVGDADFEPNKPPFRYLPVHWMAPEAMAGRFSDRSDVWSFSMLLYEVYSLGEFPFASLTDHQLPKKLKAGLRPGKPEFASDEIFSIMSRCWHRYPDRRPTFVELHSLFHSILERQYDNPAFVFEHSE